MGETPDKIGPYQVLGRLGEGGMAETFIAEKRGPGGFVQRVCVKRIRPGYDADPEYVRQFLAEARIAATLRHTNVAQVVDFGQDGEDYFLALELIDGMDLRALLTRCGGRLDPELVAHLGIELSSALDVAQRAGGQGGGIVHRDVSPSNVLLSLEGEVKLTDFGIARRTDEPKHTRTGIIRGKVPYMAPEYAESGRYDHQSDLFALGVVLYEALSGQRPHDGSGDFDTLRRASLGQHPALDTLCPHAPAALCQLVERLLAPDPAERPQAAAEVIDALTPLRLSDGRRALARLVRAHRPQSNAGHQPLQGEDGTPPTRTEVMGEEGAEAVSPNRPPSRAPTRTGRSIAIAVVGLPLLAAGGIWLIGHDIRPTPSGRSEQPTAAASRAAVAAPAAPAGTVAPAPAAASPAPINDGRPSPAADAGVDAGAATAQPAPSAQLTVVVIPFGTATVNGSAPRRTPLKLQLPAGTHMVRASGRGQNFERAVRLEPGQSRRVVFQ